MKRFFSNKGISNIITTLKKRAKKNNGIGNYYEYLTSYEINLIKFELEEEGYRVKVTLTGDKNSTLITIFA